MFKYGYNPALPIGAWRSPASALAWGARGRRFKSSRPDTTRPDRFTKPVRSFLNDMTGSPSFPSINRKALIAFVLALLAILAFCVGLLPVPFTALLCYPPGILLGIASLVLGAQSLREIRQTAERGRVLAVIAMWVSGLMVLASVCLLVFGILLLPYITDFLQNLWEQVAH